MTFDLLVSSGYVAFSGVTDAGDAAELVAPLHAPFMWRGVLILLGSVVYFLSMQAAAYELKRFAGGDDGMQRRYRLVWTPSISAGVFACCTAAMNRIMEHGAASGFATASAGLNHMMGPIGMAAAFSFGAGMGMFALPAMQRGMRPGDSSPALYLEWSAAWGAVAGAVTLLFLFYIGPGLQ